MDDSQNLIEMYKDLEAILLRAYGYPKKYRESTADEINTAYKELALAQQYLKVIKNNHTRLLGRTGNYHNL